MNRIPQLIPCLLQKKMGVVSDSKMVEIARGAWEKAYPKHTGFRVGAAILAKSGKVYTGSNVESDIPSLSICADRLALFNALSAGEREFEKLAVITETRKGYPCGSCRQILFEFCGPGLKIIMATIQGPPRRVPLSKLLPFPYKMERP